MGLLGWLFGSRPKVASPPAPATMPGGFRIPAPRKRGVPPEEYAANLVAYREGMQEQFRATARVDRERREAIGITRYKWRASGTKDCDIARRNDGKTFSSARPPKEGHPAEGKCNSDDWCQCYAEAVIPGIK